MAFKKVKVTRELIERATQRDSRHCMIAEAIKAANPRYLNIAVDLQTIRYTDPRTRKRYTCLTPQTAGHALVEFDQGPRGRAIRAHAEAGARRRPEASRPGRASEHGARPRSCARREARTS
jgi:hypothetical protein